ncbi:MAG: hypothetical protein AB7Q29_13090 [Vicinamibacterales bacterium]
MIANLHDVLKRIGPLDDRLEPGTPRGLFHQFLAEYGDPQSIGALLAQCQEQLGQQYAFARQDLVVKLGERLGFEPSYGAYEPARGTAQDMGRWRSPTGALILLDVRSERTPHDDATDLMSAIDVASAVAPAGPSAPTGLLVITPFYVSRDSLEAWLSRQPRHDLRCVSVKSLVRLAEMRAAGRLSHDEIVRLLTHGFDADFMIELARGLTLGTGGRRVRPAIRPRVAPRARHTRGRRVWIAMLAGDESASPRQLLECVIHRRRILGVSRLVAQPSEQSSGAAGGDGSGAVDGAAPRDGAPRAGERVAFYIAGEGIVGHATLDGLASNPAAVIRHADRFAAVCRLRAVEIYEAPRFVEPSSRAGRVIYGATGHGAGSVMYAVDQTDSASGSSADAPNVGALAS